MTAPLADCCVSLVAYPLSIHAVDQHTDSILEKYNIYSICKMYINNESQDKIPTPIRPIISSNLQLLIYMQKQKPVAFTAQIVVALHNWGDK